MIGAPLAAMINKRTWRYTIIMIGEDRTHLIEEGMNFIESHRACRRRSDRNDPHTNLRFRMAKGLKVKQLSIEKMTGDDLGQGRKQTVTRAGIPSIPFLKQGLHVFAL